MNLIITHNKDIEYSLYDPRENFLVRSIGRAADFCLKSKIFSLLTLGHLHTLIHETGHAVAYRMLTGGKATIHLSTASCYGFTRFSRGKHRLSSIGATWVDLSGPLANIIFSIVLIIGVLALTHYAPIPKELSLGLRITFSASSIFWIIGEFFYAGVSTYKKDKGDFGNIANRSSSHLLVAFALLITTCALGALGATMLL